MKLTVCNILGVLTPFFFMAPLWAVAGLIAFSEEPGAVGLAVLAFASSFMFGFLGWVIIHSDLWRWEE